MIIIENFIFSAQKIGGMSVVWYELVNRLARDDSLNVHFIEYDGANENMLRNNMALPSSKLTTRKIYFKSLAEYINPKLKYPYPFVFHSSNYRIARNHKAINIVTVHDFIYFISTPHSIYSRFIKWIHCFQMHKAINKASFIICISNNTKADLMRLIPTVDHNRIKVIYNGVSDDYFPIKNIESINLPFPPKNYVLFIGRRSRYKNFKLSVEAVSKTTLKLLIVGKQLNNDEIVFVNQKLGESNYKCLTNINNNYLNELYNGAFCLLYPSSYEGFGIPIIEAQKAGCPVIAYNSSSIPEIIGETPLLIESLSVEKILQCFNLLEDPFIRNHIIEKGINNSNGFSWDRMYEQTKKLYCDIQNEMSGIK